MSARIQALTAVAFVGGLGLALGITYFLAWLDRRTSSRVSHRWLSEHKRDGLRIEAHYRLVDADGEVILDHENDEVVSIVRDVIQRRRSDGQRVM